MAMFGFRPIDSAVTTSFTSDVAVEEERFVIASPTTGTFQIRWGSGTNGWNNVTPTNNKTAATLLGFLPSDDSTGALAYSAFCPRGEREVVLASAEKLYGARDPVEMDSACIRSNETAREIRNRLIDLLSKPRVQIQFSTDRAPDLERGHVITFASDVDGYHVGYPEPGTDGLWFGKRFVVTEIEHSFGPQTCATKVVAVSLG
jgi:hypothetical protein